MTTKYKITVQTGDKRNAGIDARAFLIIKGENGAQTRRLTLYQVFQDNFNRGKTDVFSFFMEKYVGKIHTIELWRDKQGGGADWYVDNLKISCSKSSCKYVFPVLRWLKPGEHWEICNYDTCLPQDEENKQQRSEELEAKRKVYEIVTDGDGMHPGVKNLPMDEFYSFNYFFDIGKKFAAMKANSVFQMYTKGKTWKSLDDLDDVYTYTFGKPYGINRWKDDYFFGYQRVNSLNPSLIALCKAIPDKFAVTSPMLEPFLEGLKLQEAIEAKRLFIIDLEILDNLPTSNAECIVPAPIALFFLNNKRDLMPVAIQLKQQKGDDNPVFLPSDPTYTWIMAKMWYNLADGTYHQALTHLGYTHFTVEGLYVSMQRNLSPSHPLYKLLSPHFLYLLPINTIGKKTVFSSDANKSIIGNIMNSGMCGVNYLLKKGRTTWSMDVDGTLPEDLKRRGVDDPAVLPNFYYRDDAMLLYDVIKKYVTDYVNLYYDSEDKIKADSEIQNFGEELVKCTSEGGCGMKGIPNDGKFTKEEHLESLLTFIIFTCSAQHAAVNFPQYEEYAYPANYPLKLTGKPPSSKDPLTEDDILAALPDKPVVFDTMILGKLLSEFATNCLGDFEIQYIFDPPAVALVNRFKDDLQKITETVQERNKVRLYEYPWLEADVVPNSISI